MKPHVSGLQQQSFVSFLHSFDYDLEVVQLSSGQLRSGPLFHDGPQAEPRCGTGPFCVGGRGEMARMLVTKSVELWHLSLAYIPLVQGNPLAKANMNRVEKCPTPRRY